MTHTTEILLMRHAQVDNPHNILYGRLPGFGLSKEGMANAHLAARALKREKLSAVFTSPQKRARQTAQIIAAPHTALKICRSHQLMEVGTPYQGKPAQQLAHLKEDFYTGTGCGYEQPADVVARLRRFVDKARKKYTGGKTVAVTHGDVITFALVWALGLPLEPGYKGRLDEHGLADAYPAPLSIATLRFHTNAATEIPAVTYRRQAGSSSR